METTLQNRPAETNSSGRPDLRGLSRNDAARDKARAADLGREVLTFRLGAEEYGIDILRVQEIRSYEQPTKLANAPSYLKGVVDLRGVIVPIVDLRVKFNCLNAEGEAEINAFTVVIVLNVRGRVLGAVVDSVSDVMQLSTEAIKPAPEISTAVDMSYITGIAHMGERLLIVMDIEALMSSAEMGLIDQTLPH
jgi:purine-binding chemotaxis protein CheW